MTEIMVEDKSLYSDVGGWLCLDFVNTGSKYHSHSPGVDYIESYNDLVVWARQANLISAEQEAALIKKAEREPRKATAVLGRARSMRDAMHWVFSAASTGESVRKQALDALNAEVSNALAHGRLTATAEGFEWHWPGFADELESLLWPVAKSAADLLTSERLARVRECAGDTCGWLFIDASKNHSRRWCDMRDCGNVAKAKRHYHKKRVSA
jgi:predicted RNA-binding Zn ribbon-like protein